MMLPLTFKWIQAPLAGYSCSAMREMTWQFGCVDYCCSEMLSAKHIAQQPKQRQRYTHKAPQEKALCIQLAGNAPDHLAYAAEQAAGWGAQLIDLNAGCPQPKIRKKQLGSYLLQDSANVKRCIQAMQQHCGLPVTLKIRVDGNSGEQYHHDIAKAAQDAGAAALIVHGRHWRETYDDAVHLDQIASIKQEVNIPVIANGDVDTLESALHMQHHTQCDAVMVARAAVGQPWLFQQWHATQMDLAFEVPTRKAIGQLLLTHVQKLIALDGEKSAVLQARQLSKYYARQSISEPSLKAMQQCSDYNTLEKRVLAAFT